MSKSRNWFGTLNNPTYALEDDFARYFKDGILKAYSLSLEIGGLENTIHYQWNAIFFHPVSMKRVVKLIPRCHAEPTRWPRNAWEYTYKDDDTHLEGPWQEGPPPKDNKPGQRTDLDVIRKKILDGRPMDEIKDEHFGSFARYEDYFMKYQNEVALLRYKGPDIQLYDWQTKVLDVLKKPADGRTIIWIWSPESETGKSTFYRHVFSITNGKTMCAGATLNDTLYHYNFHKIVWFNISRHQAIDQALLSHLETISDGGPVMSSKYKAIMKIVNARVVVTTNHPPPEDLLPGRLLVFQAHK